MNFAKFFRILFNRTPPGDCFLTSKMKKENPKTLTLNFTFGYCSGACAGLKITVYIFCWFLLHVTMTSWVKKFCSQNLLNLVSMEREFMQINFCYKTYSWFLFIFGLLAFKECITWSWYKGGICFSRKIYRTMYYS